MRELEGQVALLRDQNAALQQELQMTRDAAHTMRSLSIPLDPVEAPDPVRSFMPLHFLGRQLDSASLHAQKLSCACAAT